MWKPQFSIIFCYCHYSYLLVRLGLLIYWGNSAWIPELLTFSILQMSGQLVGKRDILQGIQVLMDFCGCVMNVSESLKILSEQPTGASSLMASIQYSLWNWDIWIFESKLFYCEKRAALLLILGETEYKNTERKHKQNSRKSKNAIFLYSSLFICNCFGPWSIDIIQSWISITES